jgi:Fe-S cluster biogenesis protein NfuA/NifU-like protein involved in Fe-S cluster formation
MEFEYSKRIQDIAVNPKNLVQDYAKNTEGSVDADPSVTLIDLTYEIPNSNGEIKLFVSTQEGDVKDIKYITNITGPSLAFLDTLVDFMKGKNAFTISHITVREIEHFLRDKNSVPSMPNDGTGMYRIFEIIKLVQDQIKTDFVDEDGGGFSSPSFENYKKADPAIFDSSKLGDFADISSEERFTIVNMILDRVVNPFLAKDGGGAECSHIMGADIVVLNFLGNCSSCTMSLTTTMDFVQDVIRVELEKPDLMVMTDS